MFKIDIHTHILPKNWPDLQQKYGYRGFVSIEHTGTGCARMLKDGKVFRNIQSNSWDIDTRIAECDKTDIQVQVLSTVPVMFSYWAKPEHTLDLSRFLNDHIAATVAKAPKRFVGLGTLPMQAPDLAVSELKRCVSELGLAGIQIGTHVNGTNLGDAELFSVYEAAQDLGAAIFVHPWEMMCADRLKKYWLSWLVGMPAELAVAISSMIFGGVFERFPNLRIAFAHGGGAFPSTLGRIQHGFDVRPDLCAIDNPVAPSKYLGRFYVDSLVHDARVLQYLLETVGPEKIALGSDYPFPLGEALPGQLIERLDLDPSVQSMLYQNTALDWLNMTPERFQ